MVSNLLADIPDSSSHEQFQNILSVPGLRVERIISWGHSSPADFWYDQDADEWVLLVAGAARMAFDGSEPVEMRPGSYLNIPAHLRHRVDWTDPDQPTVWLAIHHGG